jgi:hypothetical protein
MESHPIEGADMLKLAMLVVMVGVLAGCETRTVHEESDTTPTTGLMMGPPNEKAPVQPMQQVTDPNRQIPTNSPSGY